MVVVKYSLPRDSFAGQVLFVHQLLCINNTLLEHKQSSVCWWWLDCKTILWDGPQMRERAPGLKQLHLFTTKPSKTFCIALINLIVIISYISASCMFVYCHYLRLTLYKWNSFIKLKPMYTGLAKSLLVQCSVVCQNNHQKFSTSSFTSICQFLLSNVDIVLYINTRNIEIDMTAKSVHHLEIKVYT